MSEFALETGAILAGKYRIEAILGRGGMGIVAAAYHLQLEQRVAIKLMLPHALATPGAVSRFLREARAAAHIQSEHVARVFDVGSLPSGEPYIAMEYLQGSDLAEVLSKQGLLAPEIAVDYVLQACEALAEAHAAGIVHRDLKPGNLFLTRRIDGQRLIKVLDFGISKVTGAAGTQSEGAMTRSSALMGSPLYMSPEQMTAAKAVDARSDLWALGVVLYEMLCGVAPFNGATLPQVCIQIMTQPPPPLGERVSGLPPLLLAVVNRCLQKEPEARFQTVAEFAQALSPLASLRAQQSIDRISCVLGVATTQRSVPPPADAVAPFAGPRSASVMGETPQLAPATHSTWANTRAPAPGQRRSRAGVWTSAATGGALLLGTVVWFTRPPSAAERPAASVTAFEASSPPQAVRSAPSVQPLEPVTENRVDASSAGAAASVVAPTVKSPSAGPFAVRASPVPTQRVAPDASSKLREPVPVTQAVIAPVVSAVAPAPTASVVSEPVAPPRRSRL